GGYDTFEHGQLVDHAVPNVLGGFNHFDAHGSMHASSHDNILAGVDLADASGQLLLHTQPHVLGGLTVTEPGGCPVADALSDPSAFQAALSKGRQSVPPPRIPPMKPLGCPTRRTPLARPTPRRRKAGDRPGSHACSACSSLARASSITARPRKQPSCFSRQ